MLLIIFKVLFKENESICESLVGFNFLISIYWYLHNVFFLCSPSCSPERPLSLSPRGYQVL